MHRSNLVRLLAGLLFLLVLALAWTLQQRVDPRLKMWMAWITATYACVAGFWIWKHGLRLARLIHDVPTSRVATAAQGYVELLGRAARFEDQQADSQFGAPVLWQRKEYARRGDPREMRAFPFNLAYVPLTVEESRTPFAVDDGTGAACVMPHGAEIICARKDTHYGENTRVVVERILPGDTLYVIGDFSTYTLEPDLDRATYELTRKWDEDPARRRAFDRNRDGRLDPKEWLEMHEAARAHAIKESLSAAPAPKHRVFQPADGRPFLISSVPPAELAGHYRLCLAGGLLMFVGGGALSAALILKRLLY